MATTVRIDPLLDGSEDISRPLNVYVLELWSFVPYYVAALSLALKDSGAEVTLGSARYHLDRGYFATVGIATDRWLIDVGGSLRHAKLRRMVKAVEYLLNLCLLAIRFRLRPPDVLHVQYLPFLDRGMSFELWFLRFVQRLGTKVVYTVHNVTNQDREEENTQLYARVYHLADALICHGDQAFARLKREFHLPGERFRVIPHGPLYSQPPRCSPALARASLGIAPDSPLVLCCGVISEYKGIPFLLEAWKKVIDSGTQGRLLIAGIGDPALLDMIRSSVATAGLQSSVDLHLGFVPVDRLPYYYQAADVLVYPYKAGTTSGALLTGLQYKRSILATDLPVFREHLRHGENAMLAAYGDSDCFAKSLRLLLEEPALRNRLGEAAFSIANRSPSWKEIAQNTKACYLSLVNERWRARSGYN